MGKLFKGGIASAISSVVSSVGGMVSGIVGSATPMVTNVANSPMGESFGKGLATAVAPQGALGGLTSALGATTGKTSGASTGKKLSFFAKLFNYKNLDDTTPILTDKDGNESFNYVSGMNIMKIVGHVLLFTGVGFIIYKLMNKKKGGSKW